MHLPYVKIASPDALYQEKPHGGNRNESLLHQ